ncbi:MAG: phage holin family protein [Burkholderiales bacterium]|nr:MAG: phage holin family protein [Burkholderiales bacterium]
MASIPDLTKDVAHHLGDMFRNELRLARAEAVESAKSMSGAMVQLGVGIAFATAAVTLGFLAVANGFSIYIPMWAGLAIAALAAALAGLIFILSARATISPKNLTLPKTRDQIGRDIQSIKEHLPS